MSTSKRRLLFVSPYFPPLRAIGSKRAVNVVQGLTDLGWEVDVLCSKAFFESDNTPYQFEVPKGVTVNRGFVSRTLRPIVTFFKSDSKSSAKDKITYSLSKPTKPKVSLTPFDQYLWDVSGAVKAGKKMIKKSRPDVILVNADPWSGLLVGQKLSKWSGVPWVADFRDPWTAFEEKMNARPALIQQVIRRFEKKFFQSASAVIFNTENALASYVKLYANSHINDKFTYIRNSFNPGLLEPSPANSSQSPFIFGYFGSFRDFVSSRFLLEGFRDFLKQYNVSPAEVRMELVGKANNEFHYYVDKFGLHEYVVVKPSVPYRESLKVLRQWNTLVLVLDPSYKLMIPAKLYDYLYAQRPIMALSDNGEVNSIIKNTSSGYFVSNDDVESIANLFREMYQNYLGKGLLDNDSEIEPYGLISQSEKFESVLNSVLTIK